MVFFHVLLMPTHLIEILEKKFRHFFNLASNPETRILHFQI